MRQNRLFSLKPYRVRAFFYSTFLLGVVVSCNNCSGGMSASQGSLLESENTSNESLTEATEMLKSDSWSVANADEVSFRSHVINVGSGHFLVGHGQKLRRMNYDNSIDTSFGIMGEITVPGAIRAVHNHGASLWVASTVPGSVPEARPTVLHLQKYDLASGAIAEDFGLLSNGIRSRKLNLDDTEPLSVGYLTNVMLNTFSNGDILLVLPTPQDRINMFRIRPTGNTLLWSNSISNAGYYFIFPRHVKVLNDDRFLITGYSQQIDRTISRRVGYLYAARVLPSGALDTTFADQGEIKPGYFNFERSLTPDYVFTSSTSQRIEDEISCCVLQDDAGRIYFFRAIATGTGRGHILIVRTNSEGILDASFGTGGYILIRHSTYHFDIKNVVTLSTGKIMLLGGVRLDTIGYPYPFYSDKFHQAFMLRLNSNFTVDTNFGSEGFIMFGSLNGISESVTHMFEAGGQVHLFGSVWMPRLATYGYRQVESRGHLFYKRQ